MRKNAMTSSRCILTIYSLRSNLPHESHCTRDARSLSSRRMHDSGRTRVSAHVWELFLRTRYQCHAGWGETGKDGEKTNFTCVFVIHDMILTKDDSAMWFLFCVKSSTHQLITMAYTKVFVIYLAPTLLDVLYHELHDGCWKRKMQRIRMAASNLESGKIIFGKNFSFQA
jgi:hypothetical protein